MKTAVYLTSKEGTLPEQIEPMDQWPVYCLCLSCISHEHSNGHQYMDCLMLKMSNWADLQSILTYAYLRATSLWFGGFGFIFFFHGIFVHDVQQYWYENNEHRTYSYLDSTSVRPWFFVRSSLIYPKHPQTHRSWCLLFSVPKLFRLTVTLAGLKFCNSSFTLVDFEVGMVGRGVGSSRPSTSLYGQLDISDVHVYMKINIWIYIYICIIYIYI